jgi:hypothetical protein
VPDTRDVGIEDQSSSDGAGPGAASFLAQTLAGGALAVVEIEARARSAGLLGDRQRITNAKAFKGAKKKLKVRSVRLGFGRRGEWFWELPSSPKTLLIETVADHVPKMADLVVYGEDHSRPEQDRHANPGADDGVEGDPVPPDWRTGVAALCLAQAPRDVPAHRWQVFVTDCHRFMNSSEQWPERAAKLGWDAVSLFGCRSVRPVDHLGCAGLLWHLAGGKIIRLHEDWAMIAAANGAERFFHRRPVDPSVGLPWNLRLAAAP